MSVFPPSLLDTRLALSIVDKSVNAEVDVKTLSCVTIDL
jgi:hypothetical protein